MQSVALFCLTILPVYAEDNSSLNLDMPLLVINLSSVAAAIFQQQAQIWFFLLAVALFVCFVASLLMNRPIDKSCLNQGDLLAKKVSIWWMVFLLLLIMGFAMPMLRVWLVLMG
ncbi:MAG: hypothetical protein IPI79_06300 [Moraxellaceae bacterium]|nr:hypothetical protein [Moraxellaceae bacterium]